MDLSTIFNNEEVTSELVDTVPEVVAEPKYQTYEDFDPEQLFLYAGIDTYVTSTVVSRQFPAFVAKPKYSTQVGAEIVSTRVKSLIDVYSDYAGPMFEFITDLEINGINYDPVFIVVDSLFCSIFCN